MADPPILEASSRDPHSVSPWRDAGRWTTANVVHLLQDVPTHSHQPSHVPAQPQTATEVNSMLPLAELILC